MLATSLTRANLVRLRTDLKVTRTGDEVLLADAITSRVFRFVDEQADLIGLLERGGTPETIADELFGDPTEASAVHQFVVGLRELGLLEGADTSNLAILQAKRLRSKAAQQRDQRVAATVRWAATELPFYRTRIGQLADTVNGVRDLARLPTTTKQDVRDNFPTGLLQRGTTLNELLQRREIALVTSSGSTGGRLEFLIYMDRAPHALDGRHPGMKAAGDPELARIGLFTTPICSGAVCHRSRPMHERMYDNNLQFTISSSERIMRLRREELDKIVDEFERFQPDVLYLDPIYGVALVRALQRHGLPIPRVSAVFSAYEFLSVIHRDILTEAFGVPIYQLYGASEINNMAAFTCENGRFHVINDRYVFEFVRNAKPVTSANDYGEITVTMLSRPYSRFVRYQIGDLGRPIDECGCQFDDLQAFVFEGRIQDLLFTTAGEPVTTRRVDQLFEGLHWIDFYQMRQRDRHRYELMAVPREGVQSADDESTFRERVHALFGADAQLGIGYVRELSVNPSLKYPLTMNRSQSSWDPNG